MARKRSGDITRIGDLFDVYKKKLRAPQGSVCKEAREVIMDLTGVELTERDLSYRVGSRTLSIHKTGPLKQELMLRKDEILTHLTGRLGEAGAPTDIL